MNSSVKSWNPGNKGRPTLQTICNSWGRNFIARTYFVDNRPMGKRFNAILRKNPTILSQIAQNLKPKWAISIKESCSSCSRISMLTVLRGTSLGTWRFKQCFKPKKQHFFYLKFHALKWTKSFSYVYYFLIVLLNLLNRRTIRWDLLFGNSSSQMQEAVRFNCNNMLRLNAVIEICYAIKLSNFEEPPFFKLWTQFFFFFHCINSLT